LTKRPGIQHAVPHLSQGPEDGGLRVKCVECGAKTAGAAQFCLTCGAPAPGPGFSSTRMRPGYAKQEVDAFLEAIRDTLLGLREPPLTAGEIRHKQFATTRGRSGYDEQEVDAFLDEAEARLRLTCAECGAPVIELGEACAECGAPPAGQRSAAADTAAGGPGSDVSAAQPAPRRRRIILLAGLTVLAAVGITAVALGHSSAREPARSSAREPASVPTGRLMARLTDPDASSLYTVAFSPDGRILAAGNANGSIYLWDVATGHLAGVRTDPGFIGIFPVAFSPDGRMVAAADSRGRIYLWNAGR
jgi:DivIVA domain-containing protein